MRFTIEVGALAELLTDLLSKGGNFLELGGQMKAQTVSVVCKHFDVNGDGVISVAEFHRGFRIAERSMKTQSLEAGRLFAAEDHQRSLASLGPPVRMSEEDIVTLMAWIDSSGDGQIDFHEFEDAFRRARRAHAEHAAIVAGRELMKRLSSWMDANSLTVDQWFALMDSGGDNAKARFTDGTVTTRELRQGLRRLMKASDAEHPAFTEEDLFKLLRFMDPSGDGELNLAEVRSAFASINTKTKVEEMEGDIGDVLHRCEQAMKGRRLKDFFIEIDVEDRGVVSSAALKEGLERLLQPSANLRATIAKQEKTMVQLRRAYNEILTKAVRAAAQIRELEANGVADVMRRLDSHIKNHGKKIVDLFHDIDVSGDGRLDGNEVADMLERLSQPSLEARVARKKKELKIAQRRHDEETKRIQFNEMMERMARAEKSGAAVVLSKLEFFMRRWQMRCIDLFRLVDADGGGTVDADELAAAIECTQLNASPEQVRKLVDYLDTGGDGQVDHTELESAIRYFRRYRWEKAMAVRYSKNGKLPLYLKYQHFEEIFVPSDPIHRRLTAVDIALGLKRLRGDADVEKLESETVKGLSKEQLDVVQASAEALSKHLRVTSATVAESLAASQIVAQEGLITVAQTKKWIAGIQVATGQAVIDAHKHTFESTQLDKVSTNISGEDMEQVMKALDPDDNGMDLQELENAFQISAASNAHALLQAGALASINILRRVMTKQGSDPTAVLHEMEVNADGKVTCDEVRRFLTTFLASNEAAVEAQGIGADSDADGEGQQPRNHQVPGCGHADYLGVRVHRVDEVF